MPFVPLRSLGLAVGLFLTAAACAAGNSPAGEELVRRLGDPSFAEREGASAAILRLGRSAVPALEGGLKDSDAEVRRRCAELLPLARRSDLEIRFDQFTAAAGDGPAPLPGWAHFRQLAGDDRAARLCFVALGRADHQLLETLEKDPALVGSQLAERTRRVAPLLRPAPGPDAAAGGGSELAGLLLAAACSADKNTSTAHQFFNTLYQPAMRSLVRDGVAERRLLSLFLARQLDEPWRLQQTVWLARNLGLSEFLEGTLKPRVRRQAAEAAAKPDDPGNLYQVASAANLLGLGDAIETHLKPAAHTLAEKAGEKADDPGRVFQVLNVLQTLQMQDDIDTYLRPTACRTIAAVAGKPYDQYRFHLALNLARSLKLKEPVDEVLKPAAVKALKAIAEKVPDDPGQMYAAISLVQTFDLKDAGEEFLKPAGRRLAAAAAKSGDVEKMLQAAHFATTLTFRDAVDDTLRPAVRRLAAEPKREDVNRLAQLIELAQYLNMTDTVEGALKPRVRKVLVAADAGPPGDVNETLQLAGKLGLKEGVPYALKAARSKQHNAWTRGAALLFVAEFGRKEHVAELEPLLDDKTTIGSLRVNFTTIRAEVADVALAAVVTLSGQSLDDYDYPYLKFHPAAARPSISTTSAQCFGFADAAGRTAAFKKWKERAAAKK
jgi:hypothetical protein